MIIGISGHIGSGKDTLAEYLKAEITYRCNKTTTIKKFADNLKKITAIIAGVSEQLCYTEEGKNLVIKEYGMTIGEMQQIIGTKLFRDNFNENVWVHSALNTYRPSLGVLIVSDVRFPNEANAIIEKGGFLIRLEGDPSGARARSKRDLTHPSETSLDSYTGFTHVFNNVGDVEELKEFAKHIVENHFLTI